MRILFVASEASPFAKTGGLADVAGALPQALAEAGHDVRLIIPLYQSIDQWRWRLLPLLPEMVVEYGGRRFIGSVMRCSYPCDVEVPVYFVHQDEFFDRPGLYGENNRDYPDNGERFAFFCVASLWTLKGLDWKPDVIHLNDWQSGLIAPLIKHHPLMAQMEFYQSIRTLFTIHNLAYQGLFTPDVLFKTGLPGTLFSDHGAEYYGKVSTLKCGLVFADKISTVSPTYAKEIQTEEYGSGMQGVLQERAADLHGILNGIDDTVWNPATDPLLPVPYTAEDIQGKEESRQALLEAFNMEDDGKPIIGMVSRLVTAKGFDIVAKALPALMTMGFRVVLLGTGDAEIEDFFRKAQEKYPDRFSAKITYNEELAHLIQAGSDFFMVPSRYEPSGLTQLYAMRYGTIPIVRATGGLADSVVHADDETIADGSGTGFLFERYHEQALALACDEALQRYRGPEKTWLKLRENAMRQDFSWRGTVSKYEELYEATKAVVRPTVEE
ncbi:MAG: glycogen synthase GlgA [Sumerlaeia bacterium]